MCGPHNLPAAKKYKNEQAVELSKKLDAKVKALTWWGATKAVAKLEWKDEIKESMKDTVNPLGIL